MAQSSGKSSEKLLRICLRIIYPKDNRGECIHWLPSSTGQYPPVSINSFIPTALQLRLPDLEDKNRICQVNFRKKHKFI